MANDSPVSVVILAELNNKSNKSRRDEVAIEVGEGKLCRICHLSREKGSDEAVLIGCGCKGELGYVHPDCGEAWFRVRGNRYCEICGMFAENINGDDNRNFMEVWNEGRTVESVDGVTGDLSERGISRWRRRPLCNILMGCLVLVSVLLWFFRVKLF
ncbi:uncharacterized protein A4U43_C01F15670 [Asparagus officinalis]|uniref:RING-CH-type domain-containing protein n=1 Tax=Asparagus officinalis TaxID=4686 RepID=A0A5P1FTC1_ASPOF|nr:uncharacterized protein LOC109842333 [Asparagus officinalis]ONK80259.1 uncharacterized protein A4U43_C01F15670 [Asparagus officinalis]